MTYVELLRVRRALIVFTLCLAAIVILTGIGILSAHGSVSIGDGPGSTTAVSLRSAISADFAKHHNTVLLSWLIFIAAYISAIVATVLGAYLAAERRHTPLSWTKPTSRERFALATFAVDAVGIAAAFFVTLILGEFVVLWILGIVQFVRFDSNVWVTLALTIGIVFAYYGVVRALTVPFPERSGAIAGASWAVAFALILFAQLPLPSTFHVTFVLLNFLNPLAYGTHIGEAGDTTAVVPLTDAARIACVWTLAIVSSALAIVFYRRAEA